VTARNELPSKGRRLRDFELPSAAGRLVRLSDYRSRSNPVLVFADESAGAMQLLQNLAAQHSQIKNEEAEVLVMRSRELAAEAKQLKLPYPVLADEDGRIHRQVGAIDFEGHDAAALYVTDHFGEVFGVYRTHDGQPLPGVADILKWLEFVNSQCPECEPPEWPA
jgi:peroxiredoxin